MFLVNEIQLMQSVKLLYFSYLHYASKDLEYCSNAKILRAQKRIHVSNYGCR